jgi:transcriptional regulator GlxA family with amidase domain
LQEYINVVRLNEVRQLLETSSESLDNIIEKCGFASKSTFYRLFCEHYNMPPAEYRKIAVTIMNDR